MRNKLFFVLTLIGLCASYPMLAETELPHIAKTPIPGPVAGISKLSFGKPTKFWGEMQGENTCWPLNYSGKKIGWVWNYFLLKDQFYGFPCEGSGKTDIKMEPETIYGGVETNLVKLRVAPIDKNPMLVPVNIPGWTLEASPSIFGSYVAYWRQSDKETFATVFDLTRNQIIKEELVGPLAPASDFPHFPQPIWDSKKRSVNFSVPLEGYKSVSFQL